MLLSAKIVKEIEKEIKTQKDLIKTLELQEQQYECDWTQVKEQARKIIDYYYKVLKEAK